MSNYKAKVHKEIAIKISRWGIKAHTIQGKSDQGTKQNTVIIHQQMF